MANSFMLLRIAFNTAKFRGQSRQKNRPRRERESLARSAHDGVRELTGWTLTEDGLAWRHHWASRNGTRSLGTPSRTLPGLLDDMFYFCPGAWYGGMQELLRAEQPYGGITVDDADMPAAIAFLRQWCVIGAKAPSRDEGGTRLKLRPRKGFVTLLRKNPPHRQPRKPGQPWPGIASPTPEVSHA